MSTPPAPSLPGTPPKKQTPWGGILGIVGSVVAAVAVFLPWATLASLIEDLGIDIGIDLDVTGISIWEGLVILVLCLGTLVCSILAIALTTRATRRAFGITLLSAGLVMVALTLLQLSGFVAYGVFVSLAGAGLVVAGGIAALFESRRLPASPGRLAAPPPPAPI